MREVRAGCGGKEADLGAGGSGSIQHIWTEAHLDCFPQDLGSPKTAQRSFEFKWKLPHSCFVVMPSTRNSQPRGLLGGISKALGVCQQQNSSTLCLLMPTLLGPLEHPKTSVGPSTQPLHLVQQLGPAQSNPLGRLASQAASCQAPARPRGHHLSYLLLPVLGPGLPGVQPQCTHPSTGLVIGRPGVGRGVMSQVAFGDDSQRRF